MARYRFYASTGFVGADREEEIEIPDEELGGMNEHERFNHIEKNYFGDWLSNNTEFWFDEIKED